MADKKWVEISMGGFGTTRAKAAKDAEDLAFKVCVRLGLMEEEIKVLSLEYEISEKLKAVGINMLVFTNEPIDHLVFVNMTA